MGTPTKYLRHIVLVFTLLLAQDASVLAQTSVSERDPIHIPVNISVVPGVSIGDAVTGATGAPIVNTFSYNILAGRSYALEGVEFGAFWNDNIGYVRGAQFVGVANTVGGSVSGAQFAGIANAVGGSLRGYHSAGIANLVADDVSGVQSAGIASITGGGIRGVQTAGIVSMAGGELRGAQLSGIASLASASADAQISGVASLAGVDVRAIQVSGVASLAGNNVSGLQIAGVVNMAGGRMSGAQIAGLVNMAPHVSGVQIGAVNIADTHSGVPIGLVSYVRETGLRYDVWADESGILATAIRSGNATVSNYLGAGAVTSSGDYTFATVAGLGVEMDLSRSAFGTVDAITYGLHGDSFDTFASLSKLRVMAGWRVSPNVALFAGPTMNVFLSTDSDGSSIAPWSVYETQSGDVHVRMWPGFNAGLRIIPRGL